MVETWLFLFAICVVVLIPGPCNVQLAISAYQQGVLKSLFLIPAVLLGYVYGMALWALLIHISMPTWPHLIDILHTVSVAYVMWWGFHLWKMKDLKRFSQKNVSMTAATLFNTALKNPKSLLFAAGIFPSWVWDSFAYYGKAMLYFSLILICCSTAWICIGQRLLTGSLPMLTADRLYKGSASLLLFSMLPMLFNFFQS